MIGALFHRWAMYDWAIGTNRRNILRIPEEGRIYVISDIHLGDGTRSDSFLAKDRDLLDFLSKVDEEEAILVIAGDAIDFSQALFFTNILKAHGKILGAFSELANKGLLYYVLGNHDHDLRWYKDVLRIPVVNGIEVGEHTLILHGYEFDPIIGASLEEAEGRTRAHHLAERFLSTWIRTPIEHFYTGWNRFAYWFLHKVLWVRRRTSKLMDALRGDSRSSDYVNETMRYWTRSQLGDPGCLVNHARRWLMEQPYTTLICGHSHLPGIVDLGGGKRYANTGSWTFTHCHVMELEKGEIRVKDWRSGRTYDDRLYRPIIDGTFDHIRFEDWWKDNYMGLLRYRCGEELKDP